MLEPWLIQTLILGAITIGSSLLIMRSMSVSFRNFVKQILTEPESEPEYSSSDTDPMQAIANRIARSDNPDELEDLYEALKLKKKALKVLTGESDNVARLGTNSRWSQTKDGITAGATYKQVLAIWTGLPSAVKILVNNMARSKIGRSVDDILTSANAFQEGLNLVLPMVQSTTALAPKKDTFDPSMPYTPPGYPTQPAAAAAR